MANEVFKGLFGFSPEELTRQREAADTAMNYQAAQLDPFQQARFQGLQSYSSAARNLNTIGQKLFDIQDPQMRDATIIEQAFKSVDRPDSVEGINSIIMQAKQAGASPQALERLMGVRNQVEMQQAKLATEQARAAQLSTEKLPKEVQLLNLYNELPDTDPRKKMVEDMLIKEKAQSDPEFIKLQRARDAAPAGSVQRAELDKLIQAEITGRGTRGTTSITLPGQKDPKDILDFRDKFRTTVKPLQDGLQSATTALKMLEEGDKNDNPNAIAAAVRLLAKASDPRPSNEDVARLLNDPSILGGVSNWINIKLSGKPDEKTMNNLKRVARLLGADLSKAVDAEVSTQREIAKRRGLPDDEIELLFRDTGIKGKSSKSSTGVKPISEMSIEELRQEALK